MPAVPAAPRRRPRPADVAVAALVAGVLSGAPSTIHAVATGRSPLAAARAAGALLGRPGLLRGAAAHALVTAGWTVVLAAALPPDRSVAGGVAGGAAAGLGIAALDLGVVGRRYPSIGELPQLPQVLDHVAFGVVAGAVLAHRRAR